MTIQLSDGARASLDAICDTFVPGVDGLPSATDVHVPDVILGAMGGNPSAEVRDGFAGLLEGWDPTFASGSKEDRERLLLEWCDSEEVMRRAAFQALRKLTVILYYTLPWQGEGKNPVDAAIGYPGPHGRLKDAPPRTIGPLEIAEDTELDCDVGRGRLGRRRRHAAAGSWPRQASTSSWSRPAGTSARRTSTGRSSTGSCACTSAAAASRLPTRASACSPALASVAARTVNYTWCFRPPDFVRQEWKDALRPRRVDGEGLRRQPRRRLGPDPRQRGEQPALAPRRALSGGAREARLGLPGDAAERSGLQRGDLRPVPLRLPIGAKQSTMKTWLQDAFDAGARIVVNAPVERILIERREAKGVEATTADGHKLTVRARAVAAAAGAINTPGALGPLGTRQPERRQEPHAPPGAARLGDVRRRGAALDRRLRLDILRRVPQPR